MSLQDNPIQENRSLELSGQQFQELVDSAMRWLTRYLDQLEVEPASDLDRAAKRDAPTPTKIPHEGTAPELLFQQLFETLLPQGYNSASPGFLSYIPGGGLLHAAVADLISDAVNRYVGVYVASPGLAQIETTVIRWFCDMVGYPQGSGGILTTGGSLANWTAIVTARHCGLPQKFQKGVIYFSDQMHHSVEKASLLAGFSNQNLRRISCDTNYRIDLNELKLAIATDRAEGMLPLMVVGSAGTTNTGAIDDFDGLAELAADEDLWFHIDAAYGGFFMLTERGQSLFKGIQRADSITLDPHKSLFLPYGTGSLLVRREDDLRRTHSCDADYMPPVRNAPNQVSFNDLSPELSRDFRGLRVWLPVMMHGIDPFRDNLNEKLDLTQWLTNEISEIDALEILVEPELTVIAFRYQRPHLDATTCDQKTKELLNEINRGQRVVLKATRLDGVIVIRICILSFRTHLDRVQECLAAIKSAVAKIDGCE